MSDHAATPVFSSQAVRLEARRRIHAQARQEFRLFAKLAFETLYPGTPLKWNQALDAVCWQLQQMAEGKRRRLIINLPPRCLKSFLCSIALPAWLLGRDPTAKVVCASYAAPLAGELSNNCRRLMATDRYRAIFPGTRLSSKMNREMEFATTAGGYRLAITVGGTFTGRGGAYLIIDDPLNANEAHSETSLKNCIRWYTTVANSRLNEPVKDNVCIVSQRLHENDLPGYLLHEGTGWLHLNLPAVAVENQRYRIHGGRYFTRRPGDLLFPDRLPSSFLDNQKEEMGTFAFSAQYQQAPVSPEGNFVRREWFQTYDVAPTRDSGGYLVHSWDTAIKAGESNDYSVGTIWLIQKDRYHLLDVIRERLEFPELQRRVIALKTRDNPDAVLIEDKGSGESLIQSLSAARHAATPVRPEGDKLTRLASVLPMIEAGSVWLPTSAHWLEDYLHEMAAFPNGKFDDQVDSTSQALQWARDHKDLFVKIHWDNEALYRPSRWNI